MALRLGVGDLRSKEPFDLGLAVAETEVFGVVLAYRTIPVAVEGGFLWAIRIELYV